MATEEKEAITLDGGIAIANKIYEAVKDEDGTDAMIGALIFVTSVCTENGGYMSKQQIDNMLDQLIEMRDAKLRSQLS